MRIGHMPVSCCLDGDLKLVSPMICFRARNPYIQLYEGFIICKKKKKKSLQILQILAHSTLRRIGHLKNERLQILMFT